MAGAVVGERAEHARVQSCDPVEDLCLDVVHVGEVGQLDQVALHRPLLEPRERLFHLGAVVGLAFVVADRDPGPVNPDGIPHPGKRLLQRLRLRRQRGEALGGGVPGEVAAEPLKAARGHIEPAEFFRERADRLAVDLDGVQEPGLLLQRVAELPRLHKMLAHPPHRPREPRDRPQHHGLLKVAQHFMPVADGCDIVQRCVEERLQRVLLPAGSHRLQHLIEIQVGEEVRLLQRVHASARRGLLKEDALETRFARLQARPHAGGLAICRERQTRTSLIRTRHQLPPFPLGRSHQPSWQFRRASSPVPVIIPRCRLQGGHADDGVACFPVRAVRASRGMPGGIDKAVRHRWPARHRGGLVEAERAAPHGV